MATAAAAQSASITSRSQELPQELKLLVDKHVAYIQSLDTKTNTLEYWLTEHLRLNGLYWGLCALHLLKHPDALPRQGVLDFVFSCWHDNGGFGAAPGHDPHMLYTVSAVQILCLVDGLDELDAKPGGRMKVGKYMSSLQDSKTGTFHGDQYGEPDTRFLYGALNALSSLGLLHLINLDKAVHYITTCLNPDGGYGTSPGAETHSGQIFTCLGALSIAGRLDTHPNPNLLAAWLSERQISSGPGVGGLNGRPEKREDVCYSWWVLSSLSMLKKVHWIDRDALIKFILSCQDEDVGGFSDRPGDVADVFHTVFGLAGLSLLGYMQEDGLEGGRLEEVDAVYCIPKNVVERTLGKYKEGRGEGA